MGSWGLSAMTGDSVILEFRGMKSSRFYGVLPPNNVDVWGLGRSSEDMIDHIRKLSAPVLNIDQKPLDKRQFTIAK